MAGYTSILRPSEIVIDDHNFLQHCPRARAGSHALGHGYEPRDYAQQPFGSLPYAAPFDIPFIPRNEWADRIEEMEKNKTRISDIRHLNNLPSSDQDGLPYCWFHGTMNAMRLIRAANGQPNLALSGVSGAAPCKGFREQGGWSGEAVDWLSKNGINTQDEWPENKLSRSYWTDANKEKAKTRRVTEWYELRGGSFDELMTCLLLRFPVAAGYSWWEHLVCVMDPVALPGGKFGARFWNSWTDSYGDQGEGILAEGKATPGDACALRSATATAA